MYIAKILITLRKTILDPQGKAVEHSLKSLGYDSIKDTRIGKYVELKIDEKDESVARTIADEACKKLLANSVMEDYSFDVMKSEE
jgi:phosphoribosylformylglycinamidine synthase subunit PurS